MVDSTNFDTAPDEELMSAYSGFGNERAFAVLYKRYEKPLFSYFQKRLPHLGPESWTDLFQKTWLKIHSARLRYDPQKKFSSWFFTISLNTLRDHVGSSESKAYSEEIGLEINSIDDLSNQPEQEKLILLQESWEMADAAMCSLPPNQKEAFLLSEWEGLSAKEIGQVLNTTENAARQLLFRARSSLRIVLQKKRGLR